MRVPSNNYLIEWSNVGIIVIINFNSVSEGLLEFHAFQGIQVRVHFRTSQIISHFRMS